MKQRARGVSLTKREANPPKVRYGCSRPRDLPPGLFDARANSGLYLFGLAHAAKAKPDSAQPVAAEIGFICASEVTASLHFLVRYFIF